MRNFVKFDFSIPPGRTWSSFGSSFWPTLIALCLTTFTGIENSAAVEKIRARPLKPVSRQTPKPTPTPAATPAPEAEQQATTPTPAPTPGEEKWEGSAEAALTSTTGNTTTKNIGAAFEVIYRDRPWTYQFQANYLTSSSGEEITAERGWADVRSGRNLAERSDLFADLAYLNNRFAGLQYQVTPEVGYGYEWIIADALQFRTESALGHTLERRTDDSSTSFPTGRIGYLFAWKMTETAEFNHETSWFVNLGSSTEWRLRSETALSTGITQIIALKISYIYEFYNRPVLDKAQDNSTLTSSLVVKF